MKPQTRYKLVLPRTNHSPKPIKRLKHSLFHLTATAEEKKNCKQVVLASL